jgi:hypothetical protein
MSIITLIVLVAVVGMLVWAVTTLVPMPPKFQQAIYVLAVVFLALYILAAFGLLDGVRDIRIGR